MTMTATDALKEQLDYVYQLEYFIADNPRKYRKLISSLSDSEKETFRLILSSRLDDFLRLESEFEEDEIMPIRFDFLDYIDSVLESGFIKEHPVITKFLKDSVEFYCA